MKKKFRPTHENRTDERRTKKPERVTPSKPASPAKSHYLYGMMPVLEALRANARRVDKILIAEGIRESRLGEILELARQNGVVVSTVPRETLARQAARG